MWNPNIRPYAECFALDQEVTEADQVGNQIVEGEFKRLDQAQGGTAIRVVVPREFGSSLQIPSSAEITLTVLVGRTSTQMDGVIGTANFFNDTGSSLDLGPDSFVCEFIMPQASLKYPYVSVLIKGSGDISGTVDIYPHHVSHPRR